MMVRCGSCRTQFDVPGAGRFACPACGSVNAVRDAAGSPPAAAPSVGGYPSAPGVGPESTGAPPPPPPPPPPDRPSPKVVCPNCDFSFIVGEIAMATCPNCGEEVETGRGEVEAADD